MMHLLLLLLYAASVLAAQQAGRLGNVVFSSVVFRHGDRAPTESYPTDPYSNETKYWPRGFSQLTEEGEEQHYRLGRFIRKRYAHMLPLSYHHNNVYIRSTDVDRTLNSARCNLAGLYPDIRKPTDKHSIKFQAIPVHTEAISNDFLLKAFENCKKQKTLLSLLKNSDGYKCVMKHAEDVHRQVAKFAGLTSFPTEFYDVLLVQDLYRLSLPEWSKRYYPNPLKNFHLFDIFISPSGTTELQKLTAGPLLKQMLENMLDKVDMSLSPDRVLYLYSGHDSNLVDLLQALKVFNGILVPYASAVIVELREKKKEYYVTVSYRNTTYGDAHLLRLPGCKTLCPLDKFVHLVQPVVSDNITAECAEEVEEGTEHSFEVHENAVLPEWRRCFEKRHIHDGIYYVITFKVPFSS